MRKHNSVCVANRNPVLTCMLLSMQQGVGAGLPARKERFNPMREEAFTPMGDEEIRRYMKGLLISGLALCE